MNAAVLWAANSDWSVEEVELDPPGDREVLVSFEATGMCHSDHHFRTGDTPSRCRSSAATKVPAWWSKSAPACGI